MSLRLIVLAAPSAPIDPRSGAPVLDFGPGVIVWSGGTPGGGFVGRGLVGRVVSKSPSLKIAQNLDNESQKPRRPYGHSRLSPRRDPVHTCIQSNNLWVENRRTEIKNIGNNIIH